MAKSDEFVIIDKDVKLDASPHLEETFDTIVLSEKDSVGSTFGSEYELFDGFSVVKPYYKEYPPITSNLFIYTLHVAFCYHLPLILRPDDLWLTILQGFSLHVAQNKNKLQSRLVHFSDPNKKIKIIVLEDKLAPYNLSSADSKTIVNKTNNKIKDNKTNNDKNARKNNGNLKLNKTLTDNDEQKQAKQGKQSDDESREQEMINQLLARNNVLWKRVFNQFSKACRDICSNKMDNESLDQLVTDGNYDKEIKKLKDKKQQANAKTMKKEKGKDTQKEKEIKNNNESGNDTDEKKESKEDDSNNNIMDWGMCDFSTSTQVCKIASQCSLFSVLSNYVEFIVYTRCGIPKIILNGQIDDWKLLKTKCQNLKHFDCDFWYPHLIEVIDQIIATAELLSKSKQLNKNLVQFWKSIYHFQSVSGGALVTGWCNSLIPYAFNHDSKSYTINRAMVNQKSHKLKHRSGIPPGRIPSSYAKAPMLWVYLGVKINCDMIGGIVGTQQREQDGAVAPIVGWIVKQTPKQTNADKSSH